MNNTILSFNPEWIARLLLSAAAGGLIGYERHSRSKEAGVRTHAIVALAACLMMILSKYGFDDTPGSDPARIAAQVIPGIGFLGAGIIFVRNDTIQGLTTAAGIWATAGIGLAIGAGMYVPGIFTAVLIVLIEALLHRHFYFGGLRASVRLLVEMEKNSDAENQVLAILERHHLTASEIHYTQSHDSDGWLAVIDAATQYEMQLDDIIREIRSTKGVISADVDEIRQ